MMHQISRRTMIQQVSAATAAALSGHRLSFGNEDPLQPKLVAGVVSAYYHNSHADMIIGRILNGWNHDGGPGPALKLASLYVDQFPKKDLARELAKKHGFPIFDNIADAVTLGRNKTAVDGVISVVEHGNYPSSDLGQRLYPRFRFLNEIAKAFESTGRVVPVFSDKHLGPAWSDAQKMYRRAKQLGIPFMAGSSLPVTFRKPDQTVPLGADFKEIVGIGYGGLDSYGFHTLALLQAIAERRSGGETGIEWVRCIQGKEIWNVIDEGFVSEALFNAVLDVTPHGNRDRLRQLTGDRVALYQFQYRDGLRGAAFMLNGVARGMSVGVHVKGEKLPTAFNGELRDEPRFPHFSYLLKAIERMIHTGRPSYPVERTYLVSGLLDRLLTSRVGGHQKRETPELAIAYKPVDYPFGPRPDLSLDPRSKAVISK